MGRVWRIGGVDAFRLKGHEFNFHFSRHEGTLGSSFTQLPVALRREILAQYLCCVGSTSE